MNNTVEALQRARPWIILLILAVVIAAGPGQHKTKSSYKTEQSEAMQ